MLASHRQSRESNARYSRVSSECASVEPGQPDVKQTWGAGHHDRVSRRETAVTIAILEDAGTTKTFWSNRSYGWVAVLLILVATLITGVVLLGKSKAVDPEAPLDTENRIRNSFRPEDEFCPESEYLNVFNRHIITESKRYEVPQGLSEKCVDFRVDVPDDGSESIVSEDGVSRHFYRVLSGMRTIDIALYFGGLTSGVGFWTAKDKQDPFKWTSLDCKYALFDRIVSSESIRKLLCSRGLRRRENGSIGTIAFRAYKNKPSYDGWRIQNDNRHRLWLEDFDFTSTGSVDTVGKTDLSDTKAYTSNEIIHEIMNRGFASMGWI